jgi:hypothetical protein
MHEKTRFNILPLTKYFTACHHTQCLRPRIPSGHRLQLQPRTWAQDVNTAPLSTEGPRVSPKAKRSLRLIPMYETTVYQHSTSKKYRAYYAHREGTTHGCARGNPSSTRKSIVRSLHLVPGYRDNTCYCTVIRFCKWFDLLTCDGVLWC